MNNKAEEHPATQAIWVIAKNKEKVQLAEWQKNRSPAELGVARI